MGKLVQSWIEGFHHYQPDVRFENRMYGTASAIGALYTEAGDLAILGREIWPIEIDAFQRVLHYPPIGIDVATGSLDIRNMDFALNVFAHRDNPLTKLTLAQVDAVFGSEHRRGARNIRTWGDLGLTGEWEHEQIHVYGFPVARGFAVFFQDAVLAGSHRWNCDMKEFPDTRRSDESVLDGGQQILDALARDRYGIGYSNLRYSNAQVKPLALAANSGASYYEASKETLIERQYPLTRFITAFINRPPGRPVDPKLKEFLRYIISREGQQNIVRDGNYLPLSESAARAGLKKLE